MQGTVSEGAVVGSLDPSVWAYPKLPRLASNSAHWRDKAEPRPLFIDGGVIVEMLCQELSWK